jgi:hypothetical protein
MTRFCWLVVFDDRRNSKHHWVARDIVCKCKIPLPLLLVCSSIWVGFAECDIMCHFTSDFFCAGFLLFVHGSVAGRIWRRRNFLCGLCLSAPSLINKFSPNIVRIVDCLRPTSILMSYSVMPWWVFPFDFQRMKIHQGNKGVLLFVDLDPLQDSYSAEDRQTAWLWGIRYS